MRVESEYLFPIFYLSTIDFWIFRQLRFVKTELQAEANNV